MRTAAQNSAMQASLVTDYCAAMHNFFSEYGHYPEDIEYDHRLDGYLPYDPPTPENGGPNRSNAWRIAQDLGFTLTLLVTPGDPDTRQGWSFELCAIRESPGLQYCIDQDCNLTTHGPSVPLYEKVSPSVLARGAEAAVALLDTRPAAVLQVREYVSDDEIPSLAMSMLDLNGDTLVSLAELESNRFTAPFVAGLRTAGPYGQLVDSQVVLSEEDLEGDQSYLFSYQGLRDLCAYYAGGRGLQRALIARLDAAEAAEDRGNQRVVQNQLEAFRLLVQAQERCRGLTRRQAHVLEVLSQALESSGPCGGRRGRRR